MDKNLKARVEVELAAEATRNAEGRALIPERIKLLITDLWTAYEGARRMALEEAADICTHLAADASIAGSAAYLGAAGRIKALAQRDVQHDSYCAIYNEPAYPAGKCDCSAQRGGEGQ